MIIISIIIARILTMHLPTSVPFSLASLLDKFRKAVTRELTHNVSEEKLNPAHTTPRRMSTFALSSVKNIPRLNIGANAPNVVKNHQTTRSVFRISSQISSQLKKCFRVEYEIVMLFVANLQPYVATRSQTSQGSLKATRHPKPRASSGSALVAIPRAPALPALTPSSSPGFRSAA